MAKLNKILLVIILLLALFGINSCKKKEKPNDSTPVVNPDEENPHIPDVDPYEIVDGINFVVGGGTKILPITGIEKDDLVNIPDGVYDGCEFLGWYLTEDKKGSAIFDQVRYTGGKMMLYADWMPNRYTITYLSEEVEIKNNVQTYFFGDEIYLLEPTSPYYEFLGWFDNDVLYQETTMPSHDLVLTASWSGVDITISLDINGGKCDNFNSEVIIKTGGTIVLPAPSKDNYIFEGWFDDEGLLYTSQSKIYQAITLHARYKSLDEFDSEYHIYYYVNGGILDNAPEEYTVGTGLTLPIPTKDGNEFIGWYESPVFYGEKVTKVLPTDIFDKYYYAKWREIKSSYTITYIYPTTTSSIDVSSGENITLPSLDNNLSWYLDRTKISNLVADNDYTLYANFSDLDTRLKDIIPHVFDKNYNLSNNILIGGKTYSITYSSRSPRTISNDGKVNQDTIDTIVLMDVTINYNGQKIKQTFECIVPKIVFKDLSNIKPVFAYVYAGNHKGFSQTFLNTVDVINLAFGRVTDDAEVSLSDVQNKLDAILEARKSGIRVVLSIGGGGSSLKQFSDMAYTAENRLKFANSILDVLQTYHFDGVDIDWEYPGYNTGRDVSVDRPNFTLLIATLYMVLKEANPEYLITAALPGGRWGYERYALDKVEKYMDYIHLMTYDFHDSQHAYHHTALYSSSNTSSKSNVKDSVEIYVENGVPIEKIVIGCAFYGRVYYINGVNATEYGIGSPNVTSSGGYMTYTEIYNYLVNHRGEYISYYDAKACAPSIYIKSENKIISYDNANSISAKCKYVNSTDVAGIMYWENGEDQTDNLLQALYKGMKQQ